MDWTFESVCRHWSGCLWVERWHCTLPCGLWMEAWSDCDDDDDDRPIWHWAVGIDRDQLSGSQIFPLRYDDENPSLRLDAQRKAVAEARGLVAEIGEQFASAWGSP